MLFLSCLSETLPVAQITFNGQIDKRNYFLSLKNQQRNPINNFEGGIFVVVVSLHSITIVYLFFIFVAFKYTYAFSWNMRRKFKIFAIKLFVCFARKVHLCVCIRQVDNGEKKQHKNIVMSGSVGVDTCGACRQSRCLKFGKRKTAARAWDVSISMCVYVMETLNTLLPMRLPFTSTLFTLANWKLCSSCGEPTQNQIRFSELFDEENLWRTYQLRLDGEKNAKISSTVLPSRWWYHQRSNHWKWKLFRKMSSLYFKYSTYDLSESIDIRMNGQTTTNFTVINHTIGINDDYVVPFVVSLFYAISAANKTNDQLSCR